MGLLSFDKYKVEFYKRDDRIYWMTANKPKKFRKWVEYGIKTKPADEVVFYEYTGMFKDGYVITFRGTLEEATEELKKYR